MGLPSRRFVSLPIEGFDAPPRDRYAGEGARREHGQYGSLAAPCNVAASPASGGPQSAARPIPVKKIPRVLPTILVPGYSISTAGNTAIRLL